MTYNHSHNHKSINLLFYIVGVTVLWVVLMLGLWAYVITRPPETLRILWADWEPADVLEGVLSDFTEDTGVPVELIQVPWDDFQTIAYRDLDKTKPEYDIIIGDSQWLGRNIEWGERYLDLTTYYNRYNWDKEFLSEAISAYGEYPAESGKYYAVPVLGDSMGFAYRRDLFTDEAEREAFRLQYGRELMVPQTWNDLYDIAEFFNRPKEDLYGISLVAGSDYDEVTMTFENFLFSFGGEIGNEETLQVAGYINSNESVTALEFFKKLFDMSVQAHDGQSGYNGARNEFIKGRTVMHLNYFSQLPETIAEGSGPHHESIGFFMMPEGPVGRVSALGGQGASIVYRSLNRREALIFLEWWGSEETQLKWAEAGGISVHNAARDIDRLSKTRPYFAPQQNSLLIMKDFWNVPEYAELLDISQKRLSEYLYGSVTAKETLDIIATEWEEIFRESPYNFLRE